jgi:hypothetical protein
MLQVVAAFQASQKLLSASGRCLLVSIALMQDLLRRGVIAELVIGVRSTPFAAHAWVQQGELLLNDRLDVVRAYTPLMML